MVGGANIPGWSGPVLIMQRYVPPKLTELLKSDVGESSPR